MSWISDKLAGQITSQGRCLVAAKAVFKGERLIVWDGKVVEYAKWRRPDGPVLAAQIDEDLLLTTVEDGPGDWINHSCEPNTGLAGACVLVALRDIKRGEQICYDYAFTDSLPLDEFSCRCGSLSCRGKVTGNDWTLASLQDRYLEYFSPYLQRRILAAQSLSNRRQKAMA